MMPLWQAASCDAAPRARCDSTCFAPLSDAGLPRRPTNASRPCYDSPTDDPGADVRRPIFLVSALCAVLLALYSCSMRAALSTDGDGHIVKVSSVRLESSLARVAVALVVGSQVAVELRWLAACDEPPCDKRGG
jgi:hypothetical protein